MPKAQSTLLESWPALKEDLKAFLSDTDAWIMVELKKAHEAKDWGKVLKVLDVMETVHEMGHSH